MFNSAEEKLIEVIKQVTLSKYIGDDCAIVENDTRSDELLFSIDSFIENTHFKSEYFTPYDIGWKALAINISDIVAMGGRPLHALVAIGLDKGIREKKDWIKNFYEGLQDCALSFGSVEIIGGDLCMQQGFTSVTISITGIPIHHQALKRSSARPGDKVCVTGNFGNSSNFLKTISEGDEPKAADREKHLKPRPRLDCIDAIFSANDYGALMDASDGLAVCLIEIAKQSEVLIHIDSSKIPKDSHIDLEQALYGGEDYELVGTFPEVPEGFTEIGVVTAYDPNPRAIDNYLGVTLNIDKAFKHF